MNDENIDKEKIKTADSAPKEDGDAPKDEKDGWAKAQILGQLLLPLVVASVGILFTFCQNERAQDRLAQEKIEARERLAQEQESEQEKLKVDRLTTLLKHFASDNCREVLLALKASEHLSGKAQFPSELYPVFEQVSQENKCPEVQEAANKTVETVAKINSKSAEQNIAATRAFARLNEQAIQQLPARIYLHVQKGASDEKAELLKKQLESAGFIVPGIESVDRVPNQTDLRYFGGSNQDDVNKINEVLKREKIETNAVDLSSRYPGAKIRPRHYEIWLGANQSATKK